MFRYRLIYAVTLAVSMVFYLIYHPWFSWYLLVLLLVLIPLDLIFSMPGMLGKSVNISAPVFLEKDSYGCVTITAVCDVPHPVRGIFVQLRVTGDDFVTSCSVLAPADASLHSEILIDTSNTGLTVFELERLCVVSLLGLFSVRVKSAQKLSVLVMPKAQKPKDSMRLPRHTVLTPKPGGGFSEEHDMRKYQPGDLVRNIHWKLSAKQASLIIREPLVPPQQSRLIHLMPWSDAEERDSALSHLRWVSQYLFDKGLTFYIRYGDRLQTELITSEDDLFRFLRQVLDNSTVNKSFTFPRITRFAWVYKVTGGNL